MRSKRCTFVSLASIGLVMSILACNAPGPVPPTPSPGVVPSPLPTLPPSETPPILPTQTPTQATPTPTSPAIVRTLLPTVTELPSPTSSTLTPPARPTPPVSTGPLDFPVPTALDNWRPLSDGGYEATIIVRITGGAPPYTVHHDLDVFTTRETHLAIVFTARGCALVHTILVESADGQSIKHDYWIRTPWCD